LPKVSTSQSTHAGQMLIVWPYISNKICAQKIKRKRERLSSLFEVMGTATFVSSDVSWPPKHLQKENQMYAAHLLK
jgi:peroxiredoxin